MILLLLKVSFVLALALCVQPLLRRVSAALRHRVLAVSLIAAALMPVTLLFRAPVQAFRLPITLSVNAASSAAAGGGFRWQALALTFWALGTTLVLARLFAGFRHVSLVRRAATLTGNASDAPVLQADVAVPVAVGLFRPAILLPASVADWPEPQRLAALRHEAAHIERKDLWTNLLAYLVCAVYWFHPLAWAVASGLRDEQESACDDAALTAGISPVSYAEALLAAARQVRSTSLIGCHMITRTTLRNRIARLVDTGLPRTSSTSAKRRVAVASAIAIACVAVVSAGPQAPSPDSTGGTQPRFRASASADAPPAPALQAPAPDNTGKVYKMEDGIKAPRVLSKSDPAYTEEAKADHIEGTVLLSLVIGADGLARDISVVKGLDGGLSNQAVTAIQQWRFEPGTLNGEPVAVRAQIEVNFKLM